MKFLLRNITIIFIRFNQYTRKDKYSKKYTHFLMYTFTVKYLAEDVRVLGCVWEQFPYI